MDMEMRKRNKLQPLRSSRNINQASSYKQKKKKIKNRECNHFYQKYLGFFFPFVDKVIDWIHVTNVINFPLSLLFHLIPLVSLSSFSRLTGSVFFSSFVRFVWNYNWWDRSKKTFKCNDRIIRKVKDLWYVYRTKKMKRSYHRKEWIQFPWKHIISTNSKSIAGDVDDDADDVADDVNFSSLIIHFFFFLSHLWILDENFDSYSSWNKFSIIEWKKKMQINCEMKRKIRA